MRRKEKGDRRNDPWILSSWDPPAAGKKNCWGIRWSYGRGANVEHIESLKSCFIVLWLCQLQEMNHDWVNKKTSNKNIQQSLKQAIDNWQNFNLYIYMLYMLDEGHFVWHIKPNVSLAPKKRLAFFTLKLGVSFRPSVESPDLGGWLHPSCGIL